MTAWERSSGHQLQDRDLQMWEGGGKLRSQITVSCLLESEININFPIFLKP